MKQAEANRITRLAPNVSSSGLITSSDSAKPRNELPSAAAIISPECSGTAGSSSAALIAPDAPVRIGERQRRGEQRHHADPEQRALVGRVFAH